ncbi:P-loop containing nucleoside triphosphate hydrolase protein [Apodospora peruviana]|uniref:ATP-dependent RNA helicase ROK1 n=1 Tax=Apodospora peruviana TaxID=516989 RepID=A0AAE0IQ31_9PEZI|nr:P-loop containing nucleoside triphosphate hydrolase protein [Apodospora peruviana]
MDILKVLSRGIKPTKKCTHGAGASASGAAQLLPSSGALPNPQFFHDDVGGATRGKKRKRRNGARDEKAAEDDEEVALSDVDYFAPKPATNEASSKQRTIAAEQTEQPPKRKVKLLDEDECRQILRSHRLKLTVFSGRTEQAAAATKPPKEKKAKKSKDDEKKQSAKSGESKDDKKQIYTQPLNSFGELRHVYGVSPQLADNLTRQGFRAPTEVQIGSLPLQLQPKTALKKAKDVDDINVGRGIDFLGVAPTGSGKTISFLIPAIDSILRRRKKSEGDGQDGEHVLAAIVVAPTRELASQIVNEGRKLAIGTDVRVVLMKKSLRLAAEDVKMEDQPEREGASLEEDSEGESDNESEAGTASADGSEQEEEESNAEHDEAAANKKDSSAAAAKPPAKVDILVTTPKILLNFLSGGKSGVKKSLPQVRSLILDEADVLLDPIFRKQTMTIWKACSNPDLSLTCWSATMASNIEALIANEISKRCKRVKCSPKPLIRLVVGLKDTAVPNITHKLIYTATEPGKLLALRQLLHPADSGPPLRPPFLVFTQTIERAQALHDELKYDIPLEAGGSARVAVLHSSLPGSVRSKIMARFRAGEVWVLITTDVLARGVDFAGVNGIVNYDVPTSAAAYVHRAGRTGRAGREGGVAVTFYTKDDIPFVKSVANVIAMSEKQAGKSGQDGAAVQKWLLDALPKVAKDDKRKLKVRGVESRRTGGRATITTKSTWDLKRERNRVQAIEASKKRKKMQKREAAGGGGDNVVGGGGNDTEEWGGLDD